MLPFTNLDIEKVVIKISRKPLQLKASDLVGLWMMVSRLPCDIILMDKCMVKGTVFHKHKF